MERLWAVVETHTSHAHAHYGRFGGLLNTKPGFDVVVEVMSYLQPRDILSLCRLTKDFRKHLMSRKSEFIWRRARANVRGLPPLPQDLSEPAYASLAFDTLCHDCSSPGTKIVIWQLRLRLCSDCRNKRFASQSAMKEEYTVLNLFTRDQLLDLLPSTIIDKTRKFHRLDAMILQAEYESCGGNGKSHLAHWLANGWKNRPDTTSKLEHATRCEKWYKKLMDDRKKENESLRKLRHQQIVHELTTLGWGPEIEFLKTSKHHISLDKHPLVNQPSKLTETVLKNALPELEDLMTQTRHDRLIATRRSQLIPRLSLFNEVYAEWRRHAGPQAIVPHAVDLSHRPEIFNIIAGPNSGELTKSSFNTFDVRAWIHEWRFRCDEALKEHLKMLNEKAARPADVDPFKNELELASTVFICTACTRDTVPRAPLHYPEVLTHSCLNSPVRAPEELAACDDEWEYVVAAVNQCNSWSCEPLVLREMRNWACDVVEACGRDPMSTTKAQMDQLDVRLMCKTCVRNKAAFCPIYAREVFSWRAAIRHYHEHQHQLNTDVRPSYRLQALEWERVPDDQLAFVHSLEESAKTYYDPENPAVWVASFNNRGYRGPFCCIYCPKGYMSQADMTMHMSTCHSSIQNDKPDYYWDLSCGRVEPSPIMMIWRPSLAILEVLPNDYEAKKVVEWVRQGRAGFVEVKASETRVAKAQTSEAQAAEAQV